MMALEPRDRGLSVEGRERGRFREERGPVVLVTNAPVPRERLPELHGMTLVCWCYPRRCHGEVLVEHLRALSAAPTVRKLF